MLSVRSYQSRDLNFMETYISCCTFLAYHRITGKPDFLFARFTKTLLICAWAFILFKIRNCLQEASMDFSWPKVQLFQSTCAYSKASMFLQVSHVISQLVVMSLS